MYFTVNMAFAYQLQINFSEEIPPEVLNGHLMSYDVTNEKISSTYNWYLSMWLDECFSWVLKYLSTKALSLSLVIKLKNPISLHVWYWTVSAKYHKSLCQHRVHLL